MASPAPAEVAISGLAVGGDGVGRLADGRVVFVTGAVPGDVVSVQVTTTRKRFARAALLELRHPSPDRVTPPCPEQARGCGGCGLQHASRDAQHRWKHQLVLGALQRLGGLPDPPLGPVVGLAPQRFRSTARLAVVDGRAGYRRRSSHDVIVPEGCLVLHPALEELRLTSRFPGASEVELRLGVRTGERMVIVDGGGRGGATGAATVPADVVLADRAAVAAGGTRAHYHEVAAGRRWRISAGSFFQTRADGADALVALVEAEVAAAFPTGGPTRAVDVGCGVGLLAAAVPGATELFAVEPFPSAAADARANLVDRAVTVFEVALQRWSPRPAQLVVADPPRAGLGREGVAVVAATGAVAVVLVSCDAASLGRDTALLGAAGYTLERATPLELFPHTAHVEVVSRFVRR